MPIVVLDMKSPYFCLFNNILDYKFLKVLGVLATVILGPTTFTNSHFTSQNSLSWDTLVIRKFPCPFSLLHFLYLSTHVTFSSSSTHCRIFSWPSSPSFTTQNNTPSTTSFDSSFSPLIPFVNLDNIHPMQTRGKYGIVKLHLHLTLLFTKVEPSYYKTTLADPTWMTAMIDEYQALLKNNT
ncbi:hypothetical protein CR513_00027, partial [Mucuna pruriens]